MRIFRAILALSLALLWFPMTNSCAIAAAWPGMFPAACECEHGESEGDGCGEREGEEGGNIPCPGQDCAPCATLESGVNLAALAPLVMPPANWRELADFTAMLRVLAERASELLSEPPPVPPPSPPPATRDVVSMALPVRGPSLIA
jgi:hypothetical protein